MLVSFSVTVTTSPRKTTQRRKIYFGSWFQRFGFMVTWPHVSGPVVRQYLLAEGHDAGKVLISCHPVIKEEEG
jgi:hypothetical protein